MSMRAAFIALGLCRAFTLAPTALAAPIFVEDFEDGQADGWAPSGGEARLTQYAGNTALRLSGRTAVVTRADARGFTDVVISAAMAAANLDGDAVCLVEASADGGRVWTEVLRVGDGRDDGVTLHSGVVREARFDNVELLIGARAAGGAAQCWLDDVRVAGPPVLGPRARARRFRKLPKRRGASNRAGADARFCAQRWRYSASAPSTASFRSRRK